MNKVFLIGRLTADPELRYTQNQTPVASFSIAVDRRYSGKDGGQKETDFFPCVAWRGSGEFVKKYFSKGSKIVIDGHIQTRDWTDKEGNKRRSTEIICDEIEFGESKKDSSGGGNAGSGSNTGGWAYNPSAANVAAPPDFEELPDDDDGELPF